jgi:hypothetical protein
MSTNHIAVERIFNNYEMEDLLQIDLSSLKKQCELLYNESRKQYEEIQVDHKKTKLIFGEQAASWKSLVNLNTHDIHKLKHFPVYRLDFVCSKFGLKMLEITPLPAPIVFLDKSLWKPYQKDIWQYEKIVFVIQSDTFSGQGTPKTLKNYVIEKSALHLKEICDNQIQIDAYHYWEIKDINNKRLPTGRVGCYWWCEPEFLDTHPDILLEWKKFSIENGWDEIIKIDEYLLCGSKMLHSIFTDVRVNTFYLNQLIPETIRLTQDKREWAVQDQENIVLKKAMSCEGRDVYLGRWLDKDLWNTVLDKALKSPGCGFCLQQYYEPRCITVNDLKYGLEARIFYHPLLHRIDPLVYLIPWDKRGEKGNCCCNPTIRICGLINNY